MSYAYRAKTSSVVEVVRGGKKWVRIEYGGGEGYDEVSADELDLASAQVDLEARSEYEQVLKDPKRHAESREVREAEAGGWKRVGVVMQDSKGVFYFAATGEPYSAWTPIDLRYGEATRR